LTIHGAEAKSGTPSTFTLKPREDFTVVAAAPGQASTKYTVHYVPSDFPAYTVMSGKGAGTEDVLLTPDGEYMMIVDRSGAPLYYRTFLPNNVQNFQQATLPDGTRRYTVNVGVTNPNGWTLGVDHVMDDHFTDLDDYQLPAHAQHAKLQAEGHEFLLLDGQHYVAMTFLQRTVDLSKLDSAWSSQAQVMSNLLQEVDHGNVLLEWDSGNVPSLYSDSTVAGNYPPGMPLDYLHLNSIDVDPADGNLILSFRHTSSIIKIDRHTAKTIWTLGGKEDQFALTSEQVFSYQHHARMQPDGSMTVFDDGNNLHQTRVISFVLDQTNHKVTSFKVLYTKPSSQPASGLMGSAVPLSGGRLFCGWGGWYTMDIAPAVSEILGGSAVWSLQFTMPTVFSYRALPIQSP
jgi:hypothetical protein